MYTVVPSKTFRRQMRKLRRGGRYDLRKLTRVIDFLAAGHILAPKYRDHALVGQLVYARECHIAPDWLLIYRKDNDVLILELLATGNHSELF